MRRETFIHQLVTGVMFELSPGVQGKRRLDRTVMGGWTEESWLFLDALEWPALVNRVRREQEDREQAARVRAVELWQAGLGAVPAHLLLEGGWPDRYENLIREAEEARLRRRRER